VEVPVRQRVPSPHRLRSLDDELGRARVLLVDPAAHARAIVGPAELTLGLVAVSAGRFVAAVRDSWCWPSDEPDCAGEVHVDGRSRGQGEVRLVGWWSPLISLDLTASHGSSTVLLLDAVEALVIDGSSRLHLTEPAHVDWLLR
jgi:hypothetical protein